MKKILMGTLLTLTCLTGSAWAQTKANLVNFPREGFESVLWETGNAKMGKMDVTGTIQGLGAGDSSIGYKLEGQYDLLETWIGYLKTAPKGRSARFEILADGKQIYLSEPISSGTEPMMIRVPLKGRNFVVLRIRPENYGATAGAAYGMPTVLSGVRPEDYPQPLTVEINGQRTQVEQPGGVAPKELAVPIPLNSGSTEYRVKVTNENNQVKIQVEKAKP